MQDFLKALVIGHMIFLQQSLVSPQLHSRIVGGTLTNIEEAPFLVQLLGDGKFRCGATLVDPHFVVTAAHCVLNKKILTYTIVAGVTRRSVRGVQSNVKKIMFSKYLNKPKAGWDVAVLELDSPVIGSHIQPIGLCNTTWRPDSDVQIYGWGKLSRTDKWPTNHVRTATLQVIERNRCKSMYRNILNITNTMFCASVLGRKSICKGDSGGPAIINGQFCGVISMTYGCLRFPGVFTNVRLVSNFISSSIKTLSALRTAAYTLF